MAAGDGMLERKTLLLAARDAAGRGLILDPDSRVPVGSSVPRMRQRWFSRRVVEVREQQDDSLLCSVRRCWSLFPWYEVSDADDQLVGWRGGPLLLDRLGRRVAMRDDGPEAGTSRFVAPDGTELAKLAMRDDDVRLTFADEIADEPFVKMLLLTEALATA